MLIRYLAPIVQALLSFGLDQLVWIYHKNLLLLLLLYVGMYHLSMPEKWSWFSILSIIFSFITLEKRHL